VAMLRTNCKQDMEDFDLQYCDHQRSTRKFISYSTRATALLETLFEGKEKKEQHHF